MGYQLGRQFILRMAGLPMEELARLRSVELAASADLALDSGGVEAHARLAAVYSRELERLRTNLWTLAGDTRFRQALLQSSPDLEQRSPQPGAPLPARNSDCRHHENSWTRYAQRLAAKNDTIGSFGPSAWGRVDSAEPRAAVIALGDGVDQRRVYVERWVCEELAARIDALSPGGLPIEPAEDLVFDGAAVLRSGRPVTLSPAEREMLQRADGSQTALEPTAVASQLLARGLLVRRCRIPIGPEPFAALRAQVEDWPGGPERDHWQASLAAIEAQRAGFEAAPDLEARRRALLQLSSLLSDLDIQPARRSRALYAARLPLNEDCRRATRALMIGRPLIEQATIDLAPWYDLWRDLAGLFATRIGQRLSAIWTSLGARPVGIDTFFHACRADGVDLWGGGGAGLAPELYDEVQLAWQDQLGARSDDKEIQLSDDDLAFVRNRFSFSRMKSFDNPAPDLQIVATDAGAIERGDWQLLVSEIHPDLSVWEHCFMLFCPDAEELTSEYRRTGHAPAITFGPTTEMGVHILCRAPQHSGEWSFLRPLFAPGCASIGRAEAVVDVVDGDLIVRDRHGRIRGSLVHQWRVTGNTHHLELLGTGSHSPRLKVGRAIVQRESWRIEPDDALRRAVARVGPDALLALRGLRRQRGLPEETFVRPELPMRHSYYKDTKPVLVDFRNPFLIEALGRWVRRYLRLRVTEMLPASGECWLSDSAGHYSCELRVVVLPE
jgi:hypothetical protein